MLEAAAISDMYTRGMSASEIGRRLGLSPSQIFHRMDRYGIKRRSRSEAAYKKRNPLGDPFHIKRELVQEERVLKSVAVGLYWADACKSNPLSVRISHTDPQVLRTFVVFLRDICGVSQNKIRVTLIVNHKMLVKEAESFWSEQLGLPVAQFSKTTVLKGKKGIHRRIQHYGTATVQVHNQKLRQLLDR
ncbi:MAG: hypothetical protein HQ593_02315, partial [Candidatus Omnitrophica bacterium]|nr:hypothetical protein [Candidatus Omnitrophota bacterium]